MCLDVMYTHDKNAERYMPDRGRNWTYYIWNASNDLSTEPSCQPRFKNHVFQWNVSSKVMLVVYSLLYYSGRKWLSSEISHTRSDLAAQLTARFNQLDDLETVITYSYICVVNYTDHKNNRFQKKLIVRSTNISYRNS